MKLKHKALLYNFIGFALIFILTRMLFGYYVPMQKIISALIAAVVANVLAPKFAIAKIEGTEKLVMKWILKKGVKEF